MQSKRLKIIIFFLAATSLIQWSAQSAVAQALHAGAEPFRHGSLEATEVVQLTSAAGTQANAMPNVNGKFPVSRPDAANPAALSPAGSASKGHTPYTLAQLLGLLLAAGLMLALSRGLNRLQR